MNDLAGMSSMAALIREEEYHLFGEKVAKIKAIVYNHDNGLILSSEMLAQISQVLNG